MLDSPGEWFYDTATRTLYVQMPDSAAPGARVSIGQGNHGINVDGKSNINITGLFIQGTDRGISMNRSNNILVANSLIENTLAQGIDAQGATWAVLADNTIRYTGGDAVDAWGALGMGSHFTISGNTIIESGVRLVNGLSVSLPMPSNAAISAGEIATVARNTVKNSAYHGILANANSTVSDNWVDRPCMVLDDCGGIYTVGENTASRIERNLVSNIPGNSDGKPTMDTHTVGIYLDELSSNVTVANNTAIGADFGAHIHNGSGNSVTENTFYGNRRHQILFQENSKIIDSNGDVHDNAVLANHFVPTNANPSVWHRSTVGDVSRFASYDRNLYSTLSSSTIAREETSAGLNLYTFPLWRAATIGGVPLNLDPLGNVVAVKGFASYAIAGNNLISNGDFGMGIADWTPYKGKAYSYNICPNGLCLQFTVNIGQNDGLIPSPRFSVTGGQYYRVSFDFMTGTDNQRLTCLVRRGGGGSNAYESLQGASEPLVGTTSWQRHSYVFRASKTIIKNDPVTLDNGARLDFQNVMSGQTIFIDNVELVPLTPIGLPLKTNVLVNNTDAVASMPCPDETSAPSYCSKYVQFANAVPIAWPHDVQPLSAEVIYTLDTTSLDSDSDGIPDVQDVCPNTAPTMPVNSKGCAIVQ